MQESTQKQLLVSEGDVIKFENAFVQDTYSKMKESEQMEIYYKCLAEFSYHYANNDKADLHESCENSMRSLREGISILKSRGL
jgi:hypothetical protein